ARTGAPTHVKVGRAPAVGYTVLERVERGRRELGLEPVGHPRVLEPQAADEVAQRGLALLVRREPGVDHPALVAGADAYGRGAHPVLRVVLLDDDEVGALDVERRRARVPRRHGPAGDVDDVPELDRRVHVVDRAVLAEPVGP